MTITEILTLIIAFIGSSGFWTLITWISNKKSKTTKRIECIERDCNRTQLLLLISDYPQCHEEILKVANEYFVKLKGNWYMDSLFNTWLKSQNMEKPDWFRER